MTNELAYVATPSAAKVAAASLNGWSSLTGLDRPIRHAELERKLKLHSGNYDILRHRTSFVQHYGWALASKEALSAIKKFADGAPIEEQMAGGGWWAHLLRSTGIDITCFDLGTNDGYLAKTCWVDVKRHDALEGVVNRQAVVMVIWPPMATYPEAEYKAYREGLFKKGPPCPNPIKGSDAGSKLLATMAVGQKLVYVGEAFGGCNGTDMFHNILDESFESFHCEEIPQWPAIHDYVHFLVKTQEVDLDAAYEQAYAAKD